VGTDINGWIEVRPYPVLPWSGVVRLGSILDRDYDAFGSLFGVRNFAGFAPIAEGRGVPKDASEQAQTDFAGWGNEAHGATWIAASELAAIDWDERALRADARLHEYERQPSGELRYVGKSAWSTDLAMVTGAGRPGDPIPLFVEGMEWRLRDSVYRAETLTRREATNRSVDLVIRWVADLASIYGPDNVRMIVWFDD
jgi:hypothetical protein